MGNEEWIQTMTTASLSVESEGSGLAEPVAILIALSVILLVSLVLVYLLDVNYFVRTGFVIIYAAFFKKPLKFMESSSIESRVLPFDADILLTHMNNARVLREFDFGRIELLTRIGLVKFIWKKRLFKDCIYVVAHVIRYRRQLHMFSKYKIETRVVYWEANMFYMEHKVITLKDSITRCLAYSKLYCPIKIVDFLDTYHSGSGVTKPKPSKDLELWIKFNEANRIISRKISSKKINCEDGAEDESEQWVSS